MRRRTVPINGVIYMMLRVCSLQHVHRFWHAAHRSTLASFLKILGASLRIPITGVAMHPVLAVCPSCLPLGFFLFPFYNFRLLLVRCSCGVSSSVSLVVLSVNPFLRCLSLSFPFFLELPGEVWESGTSADVDDFWWQYKIPDVVTLTLFHEIK